jgi:hypothetical protein
MARSTKRMKQVVGTQQRPTKLHGTIPIIIIHRQIISDKYVGMVSGSFVDLCCLMTPCFFLFGASSYYPLHFEEILALTPPLPDDLVSIGAYHSQYTFASFPVLILMTFLILHLIFLAHTSGPEQKLNIDCFC